jgi:hypothetical protein
MSCLPLSFWSYRIRFVILIAAIFKHQYQPQSIALNNLNKKLPRKPAGQPLYKTSIKQIA